MKIDGTEGASAPEPPGGKKRSGKANKASQPEVQRTRGIPPPDESWTEEDQRLLEAVQKELRKMLDEEPDEPEPPPRPGQTREERVCTGLMRHLYEDWLEEREMKDMKAEDGRPWETPS